MLHQNRMSLKEQKRQEKKNRLKEIQNILGLAMFAVGNIVMFTLDTTGIVFCVLGAYAIITNKIILL